MSVVDFWLWHWKHVTERVGSRARRCPLAPFSTKDEKESTETWRCKRQLWDTTAPESRSTSDTFAMLHSGFVS